MNFYVASGLSNFENVRLVHRALRDDYHDLTYDWTLHGPVWKEGWERCRQVAAFEIDGVRAADVLVVLLPGGRGTHVELGVALAMSKPVILWSRNSSDFEMSPEACAFHYHPLVIHMSGGLERTFIPKLRQFFAQTALDRKFRKETT